MLPFSEGGVRALAAARRQTWASRGRRRRWWVVFLERAPRAVCGDGGRGGCGGAPRSHHRPAHGGGRLLGRSWARWRAGGAPCGAVATGAGVEGSSPGAVDGSYREGGLLVWKRTRPCRRCAAPRRPPAVVRCAVFLDFFSFEAAPSSWYDVVTH
ncbi:hypothetical protein BU14_0200s0024 [Porphyra umbilicalis]|uniref:Uncharacterized protein n=1 Tax=Porphyra umbilicalis TaxID=2786 RepID=A0A1X6P5T7_PORUM|nr:hypothetical protein BU14_0200s0024 [Porphyra umbilicalis]|eukprot:OSX76269.1 hypothetical protein BU14_0200s0024 [Porphyra umbilicalis]